MAGCVRQRPPKPFDASEDVDSKELDDEEAAMTAASAATVFSTAMTGMKMHHCQWH
jgi:hypothetical protein